MRNQSMINHANKPHFRQDDIMRCHYRIRKHGHYNTDGTCRCRDPHHRFMIEWGYMWNHAIGMWVPEHQSSHE